MRVRRLPPGTPPPPSAPDPTADASSSTAMVIMGSGARIITTAEGMAEADTAQLPRAEPSLPRRFRVSCKHGLACPNRPGEAPDERSSLDCPFLHLGPNATLCHFICESEGSNDYKAFQAKLNIFGVLKAHRREPLATMRSVACKRGEKTVYVCYAQFHLQDLGSVQECSAGVCIPAGYLLDEETGRLWFGTKADLSTAIAAPSEIHPLPVPPAAGMSFADFFRIGPYDLHAPPSHLFQSCHRPAAGSLWRRDFTDVTWREIQEQPLSIKIDTSSDFTDGREFFMNRLEELDEYSL